MPNQDEKEPRTNVRLVFVDVLQTFARQVDLTKSGAAAFCQIYDETLGDYITMMARRHPERDIWYEKELQILPRFVRGTVRQIASDCITAHTNPVDGDTLHTVAWRVMKDPEIHNRCEDIVREIANLLGGPVVRGICG